MLARNTLLVIGIGALLVSAILAFVWLRQPAATDQGPVILPSASMLVATRPLPIGVLLRDGDLAWRSMPAASVDAAGFASGTAAPGDFVGAVTRRSLTSGQQLTPLDFVKPGARDFLVATLAPGYRAVTIAVDAAQSAAGLMLPGDRVDVVLTQNFSGTASAGAGHRSVGETVLHDLRIIATDQALNTNPTPANAKIGLAAEDLHVPKTITLEVTEIQAQMLLVADQLGKLQLTLRGQQLNAVQVNTPEIELPTWAADVSPVLAGTVTTSPADTGGRRAIEVIHGAAVERECLSGNRLVACQ